MFAKKLISYFLLPFPVVLLLLAGGLVLLWFTRRQRLGKGLVTAATVILLTASWTVTNGWLTAPLHRLPPLADLSAAAGARWVVVLGSGYSTRPGVPATDRIDSAGLERLVEGIRLVRALPGAKLLLSGGAVFDGVPQAQVLGEAARALGVPAGDIVLEATSDDTQDEARLVHDIVRDDRFVLVTSTWHMRRSLALFEKQGMKPIPAPAGFRSNRRNGLPSSANLVSADEADHEYFGILWSMLRGTL